MHDSRAQRPVCHLAAAPPKHARQVRRGVRGVRRRACRGVRRREAARGAAQRGRGGRSGRLRLLRPEETSVVHGIDQGAGLVDRDLLGAGGTSEWVTP